MKAKKRKNVNTAADTAASPEIEETVQSPVAETSAPVEQNVEFDRMWFGAAAFIVAVATFLRFYDLTLKVMHHDEGVNGFFLKNIITDGTYKYDPANYHGPTLYYIALAFVKILGFETFGIRASVAVFGVLMVVLVLYLKDYLGRTGTLIAAALVALSPGMVFISRYFIHEIFFVFLSLAIVVSVLFFIEKKEAGYGAVAWMAVLLLTAFLPSALNLSTYIGGENATTVWVFRIVFMLIESVLAYFVIRMLLNWDSGRPIYLILAGASVALFFATKETAFITLGTMAIACVAVYVWKRLRPAAAFDDQWVKIIAGAHVFITPR
jgi:predicted membrane-bound mannosyltransferase